ncbi:Na+/H+ antiporter NhaA [Kineococcus gypseus]|uniref:Na+/H+ antiporter NhaA n=1 Tax=Kineococcus gypseus TaxID=1637102 RepID=UPI003D7DED0C
MTPATRSARRGGGHGGHGAATGTAPRGPARSSGHLVAQLSVPLRRLLRTEATGSALLLGATVLALVWANVPGGGYDALWHTRLSFQLGGHGVDLDLRHWVNDGLMVFFFFIVGMEVRRELSMGELTQRSRLAVPALAALAGLAVPALVYWLVNAGGPGAHGWGVAMATDTAFLLGALALVGPRASTQLRVFLLSMSVVDDIGALAAIAFFYSSDVDLLALAAAAACAVLFWALMRARVWRGPFYFVLTVLTWLAMEASGVHPTIAGVVLGLLVSAYPPRREEVESAGALVRAFRQAPRVESARQAKLSVERSISPNERIGALLTPWSAYVIVPVFALSNAGVRFSGDLLVRALTSPVTIGVVAGLVGGKFLGIGLASTLAVRLRLGALPPGVGLRAVWGGAALSGLGFTVSLFVADLAFTDERLREEAMVGVLTAALLSVLLGTAWFQLAGLRRRVPARPSLLDPPVDPARDHVRGRVDAPLTLVEHGDFECPFCGRATGVVEELRALFGDELRYVFRHLPLPDVHPHAELAAEAAEAAHAQGAFWPMHDRLFAHQDQLDAAQLLEHAAALGLDLGRFSRDLGEGAFAARVREDVAGAEVSGVRGTPTFFVNGVRHEGPGDTEALAAALRAGDPRRTAPGAGPGADPGTAPGPAPAPVAPQPAPASLTFTPPASLPEVDALHETPEDASSPRLSPAHVALLRRAGRRRRVGAGEVLVRAGGLEYDFVVVTDGRVGIVEGPVGDGAFDPRRDRQARVVVVFGPDRFFGGLNMLSGQRPNRSLVALTDAEVVVLTVQQLRALLARQPELGELITRAFLVRRAWLIGRADGLRVVGERDWPASAELARLLERAGVPFEWLEPGSDPQGRRLWEDVGAGAGAAGAEVPVVLAPDGRVLREPTLQELRAGVERPATPAP